MRTDKPYNAVTGLLSLLSGLGTLAIVSRHWRSLVTCISLVAFLLANGPACVISLASSSDQCFLDGPCSHSLRCQRVSTCTCERCSAKRTQGQSLAENERTPAPKHPGESCPCCPCPGGCAYCSVAKIMCSVSATPAMLTVLSLEETISEPSLLLPPGYAGELIRPPRG
jgi:hypothetical protein